MQFKNNLGKYFKAYKHFRRKDYLVAAELFSKILPYRKSKKYWILSKYYHAINLFDQGLFKQCLELMISVDGEKDAQYSKRYIDVCEYRLKYQKMWELFSSGKIEDSLTIFNEIKDSKDPLNYLKEIQHYLNNIAMLESAIEKYNQKDFKTSISMFLGLDDSMKEKIENYLDEYTILLDNLCKVLDCPSVEVSKLERSETIQNVLKYCDYETLYTDDFSYYHKGHVVNYTNTAYLKEQEHILKELYDKCLNMEKNYKAGVIELGAENYDAALDKFEQCHLEKYSYYKDTQKHLLAIEKYNIQLKNYETGVELFEKGQFDTSYLSHFSKLGSFKDTKKYIKTIKAHADKYQQSIDFINEYKFEKALEILGTLKNADFIGEVRNKICDVEIEKTDSANDKLIKTQPPYYRTVKELTEFAYKALGVLDRVKDFQNQDRFLEALEQLKQLGDVKQTEQLVKRVAMAMAERINALYQSKLYDEVVEIGRANRIEFQLPNDEVGLSKETHQEIKDAWLIVSNYKEVLRRLESNKPGPYKNYSATETLEYLRKVPLDYKDTKALADVLEPEAQRELEYSKGKKAYNARDFQNAIIIFEKIKDYSDAQSYFDRSRANIENYKKAIELFENEQYSQALNHFSSTDKYELSEKYIKECNIHLEHFEEIKTDFSNKKYDKIIQMSVSRQYKKNEEMFKIENEARKKLHDYFQNLKECFLYDRVVSELEEVFNARHIYVDLSPLKQMRYAILNPPKPWEEEVTPRNRKPNEFIRLNIQHEEDEIFKTIYKECLKKMETYDRALSLSNDNKFKAAIELLKQTQGYKNSNELLEQFEKLYRISRHINYFFHDLCDFLEESFNYKKISSDCFLSIAKDKVSKAIEKTKYREIIKRSWTNCLFLALDDELSADEIHEEALKLFNKMKIEHGYLFVRSYVYFILIKQSSSEKISTEDFAIYRFDEQYKLAQIKGKTSLLDNPQYSFVVENITAELEIMKDKNMDAIDCAKAFKGTLDIYSLTQEKLDSIYSQIDNNEKVKLIIEGPARSGKTIIAMDLLRRYPKSCFLLMNYHFYLSLKDAFNLVDIPFPSRRIFHHDLNKERSGGCGVRKGTWHNDYEKSFAFDLDFVIVDEAQRLANLKDYQGEFNYYPEFRELDILATRPKVTVMLGDNFQRLNPLYDEGFDKIKKVIIDNGEDYINYHFNETIGIPINLVDSFVYILDNKKETTPYIGNHIVKLVNRPIDLVGDFKSNPSYSKHFVSLPSSDLSQEFRQLGLSLYPKELAYSDYQFFLNSEIINKYVLSTYEMISRELHCLYLIIPNSITYSESQGIYDRNYRFNSVFLFNHLYVNMTRATQRLVICTQDRPLFDYLQKRIKQVGVNSFQNQWKDYTFEEQKINFVYDSSNKSGAAILKKNLESFGFKGFIHATDLNNVIEILKTDSLSSRSNLEGGFVDVADSKVISVTNEFVKSKARFYYNVKTPTLYHFNKNTSNLCILEFDFRIVENYTCYYANGNAASKFTSFTGDVKEAIKYNWRRIMERGPISDLDKQEDIRIRNAELLVQGPVNCLKYLSRIYVKDESTKNKIIQNCPSAYKDKIIVDLTKF